MAPSAVRADDAQNQAGGAGQQIRYFFDCSGKTYGPPRITPDLRDEDWQVSQNAAAEIMGTRPAGPQATSPTHQRERPASP